MAFCDPCKSIECSNPEDVEAYSLQSGIVFTSGVLSAVVSCPEGFICVPGEYPRVFTYEDDEWVIPVPPTVVSEDTTVILKGCQSDIVRVIPAGSTPAQMQAIANEMFALAAQQQAECDAQDDPNVRPRPEPPDENDLTMTTLTPLVVCVDAAYSGSVTASQAALFSIIGSLPTGLALSQSSPKTAVISGIPTVLGVYVFVIRAVAGAETAVQQVVFRVVGISTASSMPSGMIGAAYSETLSVFGIGSPTFAVTAGALPTGLSLNPATGAITGTPTAIGTFNFTVAATGT